MTDFDDLPLTTIEHDIRDALSTIRRCWPRPDTPRATGDTGTHKNRKPGSAAPGGSPTILRASLAATLAHWLRTAINEHVITIDNDRTINLGDPLATTAVLLANAPHLVGWSQARHIWTELRAEARTIERLTREPATGVHIGDCPRERVTTTGERITCGGPLWATEGRASDVKCPTCGATDTVEQWRRELGRDLPPMTADELARFLTDQGRHATPGSIRTQAWRGIIPKPRTDRTGRKVYDVPAVLTALTAHDENAITA